MSDHLYVIKVTDTDGDQHTITVTVTGPHADRFIRYLENEHTKQFARDHSIARFEVERHSIRPDGTVDLRPDDTVDL